MMWCYSTFSLNEEVHCQHTGLNKLTPIGNFVVQVCHDAKTNPHLLVCLCVVRAHLGPPVCKHTSGHLWEEAMSPCHQHWYVYRRLIIRLPENLYRETPNPNLNSNFFFCVSDVLTLHLTQQTQLELYLLNLKDSVHTLGCRNHRK